MARPLARLIDFVAAEPVRLSAFLRLPLIGLIVLLVSVWEVEHWLPLAYAVILTAYSIAALVWVFVVLRGPVPPWAGWASTGIDVLTVVALCVVSGGATVALLPVFFLLPISVAFQDRPAVAAVVGICTAVGYLGVWFVYSKRDDRVELPKVVYTHFGLLLWLAGATTALCYFLTRAAARVAALLDMRRTLVAEAMRADERHARALAEQLHDGPLQDLLAARLELDEVRERHSDPELDTIYRAVEDTATRLRGTVTALHPQVLTEVGLTAALRELIRAYEHGGNFAIEADLEEVGQPRSQSLLYRAARELLANARKHAQASTVRMCLARAGDALTLTVVDDGIGFDPAVLRRCVAEGHIGLASLAARIDAMGGSMKVTSTIGGGTRATVTTPAGAE
ncbi:sensor histidine kinase [Mycobacterium parmense]|uniref:ATPase n=1 Tax=Mycobacterium parmense TaxID=185642 RepID=A0A7I7YU29_9MYCO|nr:ATP-binding protein [Mycobacterium parmense]MCV7351276.1 sensor histidine kinase [Mycobacterium parmense]ORW60807.1 ATPase [Mycobacterium parmense]BBZ45270.1 ATPase [Mycobacterium parmense]